ncbi:solute carrier family 22 member 7-like [Latimeria chalumnae]|uniref:solute carrier family 22 member 7-like n=1 Tax=Latimeria chalumnae TaxID=7897 RepID=UPI00313BD3B1
MKFEDLLKDVGGFGRFQILVHLNIFITRLVLPFHFLLHNFLGAIPPHHCTIPDLEALTNLTQEEKLMVSIPRESGGTFSSCKMFSKPQFHLLLSNSSQGADNDSSVEQCQHGWVYNHSQFSSTIATEWDLVCERKGMNQATATFFFVGLTLGSIFFGILSDKFGRKILILLAYILSLLFAVLSAFSTSYLMFAITRTLTGFGLAGLSIVSFGLSMEWVDIEHRSVSAFFGSCIWTTSYMLLGLIAYLIRDWRWLILTVTSPCIPGIILWWWIPESARWLIANGKTEKAHVYLARCAAINRREEYYSKMTPEMLGQIITNENTDRNYTYWDLIKTPQIRKISLCAGLVWFGVSFTYYGMSLNISDFGLNMYLTQFVYGAIEIPAKIGIFCLLDRIGRRQCEGWAMILAGVSLGAITIIPYRYRAVRSIVGIVGKGFSQAAFFNVGLYTAELFPTVIRQNGLGYTAFLCRLGASAAPMIVLLEDIWKLLPFVIFSAFAFLCGAVAFLLPETLNKRLPETIDDVEKNRCRKQDSFLTEEALDVPLKPLTSDCKRD